MEKKLKCSNPKCPKFSSMRCPDCLKLKITDNSYFCSPQCLNQLYKEHQLIHQSQISYINSLPKKFQNFSFTGPLRPGTVSLQKVIDSQIQQPDYSITGTPTSELQNEKQGFNIPIINSQEDLQNLRQACLIARQALDIGHAYIGPGITTDQIDQVVHNFIISNQAYPSPLNYFHFPKSLCTSVNEVICHGIPDSRPLEEGDIINLDVTVFYKGFHGDVNETYCVGQVSDSAKKLIKAAYDSMWEAIRACKPGANYNRIGKVISEQIKKTPYSIVKTYTGHGVGKVFHGYPTIYHFKNNYDQGNMKRGHVFTIEPMINEGTWREVHWPDNWTVVTKDGKLSAQFEHTVIINDKGAEVLTQRLNDSPKLEFDLVNA